MTGIETTTTLSMEKAEAGLMEPSDDVVDDVRKRLCRAGGQVNAVEAMLAQGRECRDIVTQLAAATKALEQVGFPLIAAGLIELRRTS